MIKIKIAMLFALLLAVGLIVSVSHDFPVVAESDPILDQLSEYRTWDRISQEPMEVGVDMAPMG